MDTTLGDAAAIRKLFEDAESCGNRYRCPALDKLQDLAEGPEGTRILEAAIDIMADPEVYTFERLHKMAYYAARAWAAARTTQGRKFTPDEEKLFRAHVMRLLQRQDSALPGIGFAPYLHDARDILVAEAIKPQRNNEEAHATLRALRRHEKDLRLVKEWLGSKDEQTMMLGVILLGYLDHSVIRQKEDELPMLIHIAQRKDLPVDVALALVHHVTDHTDLDFLPALKAFAHHPDATVRAAVKAGIEKTKKVEAERAAGQ